MLKTSKALIFLALSLIFIFLASCTSGPLYTDPPQTETSKPSEGEEALSCNYKYYVDICDYLEDDTLYDLLGPEHMIFGGDKDEDYTPPKTRTFKFFDLDIPLTFCGTTPFHDVFDYSGDCAYGAAAPVAGSSVDWYIFDYANDPDSVSDSVAEASDFLADARIDVGYVNGTDDLFFFSVSRYSHLSPSNFMKEHGDEFLFNEAKTYTTEELSIAAKAFLKSFGIDTSSLSDEVYGVYEAPEHGVFWDRTFVLSEDKAADARFPLEKVEKVGVFLSEGKTLAQARTTIAIRWTNFDAVGYTVIAYQPDLSAYEDTISKLTDETVTKAVQNILKKDFPGKDFEIDKLCFAVEHEKLVLNVCVYNYETGTLYLQLSDFLVD